MTTVVATPTTRRTAMLVRHRAGAGESSAEFARALTQYAAELDPPKLSLAETESHL